MYREEEKKFPSPHVCLHRTKVVRRLRKALMAVRIRLEALTPDQGRTRENKESSSHGHISPTSVGRVFGYVQAYLALDRDYVVLSRPAFWKNILVGDMPVSPNWN